VPMPAETLANAFSQHIRQDSKEGRKQEENAREQGVTTAQKLQERKILEQQEELRRQKEQTKLLLDLKHTTQVLELQVAAVKASKSGFKAGVCRRCPRRRWARECTMLHAMGMTRTFCTCFLPAQPWTSRVCG
jgi:hypothetical protein